MMSMNKEEALKIIEKIKSFDNGIEWDNDNEYWSLKDETYDMILKLVRYTEEILNVIK